MLKIIRSLACAISLLLPIRAGTVGAPPPVGPRYQTAMMVEQNLRERIRDYKQRWKITWAIVNESAARSFDPLFVLSVMEVESAFRLGAVSATGATGLMQVVPRTYRSISRIYRLGHPRPMDPEHGVRVGICYLHYLGRFFKHPGELLTAYNEGPMAARNSEPNEYSQTVLKTYHRYLRKNGKDTRLLVRQYRKF